MITWEDEHHHSLCPPLRPSSPTVYTEHDSLEYPFGQLRSPALAVSPPNLQCTLNFLATLAVQKAEKALGLCKPFSATTKTSLQYQLCVQHKSKHSPIPATVKNINSTPTVTSTFLRNWSGRICNTVSTVCRSSSHHALNDEKVFYYYQLMKLFLHLIVCYSLDSIFFTQIFLPFRFVILAAQSQTRLHYCSYSQANFTICCLYCL